MDADRRRLLAAAPATLFGGCFSSDDLAEVELSNWHSEPHGLAVRVTGTEARSR